jgi:hypothetical protein
VHMISVICRLRSGMANKKKELKREYLQNHTPMGIYQIRNTTNAKILIGASLNLRGALNGSKVQLNAGNYSNKSLQSEWNEFGSDNFTFEILDELAATEGSGHDYRADLASLEELWLERLQPYGERGYNTKKKDTEEKLRLIAQNRLSKV